MKLTDLDRALALIDGLYGAELVAVIAYAKRSAHKLVPTPVQPKSVMRKPATKDTPPAKRRGRPRKVATPPEAPREF